MNPIKKNNVFSDERGSLLPIEFSNLPFTPKRIFVVNNVPVGQERGMHAHYETKQLIICTQGSVEVCLNDGKEEKRFILNQFDSIMVDEMIWDSQKFLNKNSEILVVCSTEYNKDDYILDKKTFELLAKKE